MSLKRKAIRNELRDRLLDETDAEERVYANRVVPIGLEELPIIIIRAERERVEVWHEHEVNVGRVYERRLSLFIDIIAEAEAPDDPTDEGVDDVLDLVAAQVQNVIEPDEHLGELVHRMTLVDNTFLVREQGETLVGVLSLEYETIYYEDAVTTIPGP